MCIKGDLCFPVGGLEEVFAAVGESVSLACRNTSPLGVGVNTKWTVRRQTPTNTWSEHGLTEAVHMSKDSSLLISKLSPLQAGDYQCVESSGLQEVFNTVRLHTLHGENCTIMLRNGLSSPSFYLSPLTL